MLILCWCYMYIQIHMHILYIFIDTTWKGSMISLGLSWPLTNLHLLGVVTVAVATPTFTTRCSYMFAKAESTFWRCKMDTAPKTDGAKYTRKTFRRIHVPLMNRTKFGSRECGEYYIHSSGSQSFAGDPNLMTWKWVCCCKYAFCTISLCG